MLPIPTNMIRIAIAICLLSFFYSCNPSPSEHVDGQEILDQSIAFHDPQGHWSQAQLDIFIQEPRVPNPPRYSELSLNNATGAFKLVRNRDEDLVTYLIEEDGESYIMLGGERDIDSALINKYRLDPSRNGGYRNFYQTMIGLPMSLKEGLSQIKQTSETLFNEKPCYKVEIELKEPLFSKNWNLFINKKTKALEGLEIISDDNGTADEHLIFEGEFAIGGMKIRRIRHWYNEEFGGYLGSDLILKELEN